MFVMKLSCGKPKTKYTQLSLYPYNGTVSREKYPLVISRSCGKIMSYATLFAYLFRRFGYPNTGWDDYKQFCTYLLSTPLPDMLLQVTPRINDDASSHFRFLLENQSFYKIEAFDINEQINWKKRLCLWIEQTNQLPDWINEALKECQQHFAPLKTWQELLGYSWIIPKLENWYKKIVNVYEKIEQYPSRYLRSSDWRKWQDTDPLKKYYQSAYETMKEFKKPVRVRDTAINAFGSVSDAILAKTVLLSECKSAGYPSGAIGNEEPEKFSRLHNVIEKLGQGNIKNGINKVLKLCKSA